MTCSEIIVDLTSRRNEHNIAGMARYGINSNGTLGVPMSVIRPMARSIGRNHELALELWSTGYHEARILASLLAEPKRMTLDEMDAWVREFDSWDICDQCCSNLFCKTPFAWDCIRRWSVQEGEFARRAGFSLLAYLAVHDRKAPDSLFLTYLPDIEAAAGDGRNFVKKAVNWALRQIGKRNLSLRSQALACCDRLESTESRSARWIARNARRELIRKS